MLSATYQTSFGLGAGLGTPTANGVVALQAALRRFAMKEQDHALDPAKYDGTVSIGTIVALANAAPKLGNKIDPVLGKAVDVISVLKKPFAYVPYGSLIIEFILSPWIVDSIYGALMGVIRLIPGGSGIANSINVAIRAVKDAIALVAAPVAAGISIVIGANLGCGVFDPLDCAEQALDAVTDAASAAGSAIVNAASAIASAANSVGSALAKVAKKVWNEAVDATRYVWNAVEKYGCALVNNDIVVAAAAVGAGIVASPAASAAIVTGAQAGKAACAVMAVVDLAYAIYKLLATKMPTPPSLKVTPSTTLVAALKAGILSSLVASGMTAAPVNVATPGPTTTVVQPIIPFPTTPQALFHYPPGTIAAFNPATKKFRVAIPIGSKLSGLGAAATHMEVPSIDVLPENVPTVPLTAFEKATNSVPLGKNPFFWVAIGVGVLAVGGGTALAVRRYKRTSR